MRAECRWLVAYSDVWRVVRQFSPSLLEMEKVREPIGVGCGAVDDIFQIIAKFSAYGRFSWHIVRGVLPLSCDQPSISGTWNEPTGYCKALVQRETL